MKNEKSKVTMAAIFSMVSVWFGAHAGGGFASGNQTMNFYGRYGWLAIIMPIISMVIVTLVYREGIIMANHHRVSDYNSLSHLMYAPYDKVLAPIYEICNIGTGILAVSASIAGGAAVLSSALNINYLVAVLILGIFVLLLSTFGSQLVARASTAMVVCIVITVILICIFGIPARSSELSAIVSSGDTYKTTFGAAFWSSIRYAGFQCFAFLGFLGVCNGLKTDRNCNKAAVMGFILNTVMLLGTSIMLLAWSGEVKGNTIPTLTVCESLGMPWLTVLYQIALLCAFISTAVAVAYGMVRRFCKYNNKEKMPQKVWDGLTSIIVIAVSMGASTFGLTKIVVVGYGYLGVGGLLLVILPYLIAGHIKNKKFSQAHPEVVSDESWTDRVSDEPLVGRATISAKEIEVSQDI